jgi:hypothetical protein
MPVPVDPTGRHGPTRRQSRGRYWRTSSRGLFLPAGVENGTPEQRIVEAAAALPRGGAVTGWAALRWAGGVWFDGLAADGITRLPVTLATGDSTTVAQPGFVISEEHLKPRDLTQLDGMPITTNVRSVTYLMRHALSDREAVTHLDMAAYSDLVSVSEVTEYAGTAPRTGLSGWTGIPRCRVGSSLAEENAWSPQEVGMRLNWTLDAALPRPLCNQPIFDRFGNHIGTPDLLDEEAGVVCEYNGGLHLVGGQPRLDRDREEAFRRVGLEVLTMMTGDAHERSRVAERMHEARGRARWAAPATRDWTIDLPSWWIPTFTVDQRRNLSEAERSRWLRLRRTA